MLDFFIIFFVPWTFILAATSDIFTMTIPNRLIVAMIVGFCVLIPFSFIPFGLIAWHFAAFALVLVLCFGLFAFGGFGGGDAKFAAAAALWLGWDMLIPFLFYTALFGGVLALAIVYLRKYIQPDKISLPQFFKRLVTPDEGIPYGIALSLSAIILLPQTDWFQSVLL